MTNLQNVLETFGRSFNLREVFVHLNIDTLIALLKTNKYFYQYRTVLYNLAIGKLRLDLMRPKLFDYFNTNNISWQKILVRIKSNKKLSKNRYLIEKYRHAMRRIDTLCEE